jgi:hypothetical protein
VLNGAAPTRVLSTSPWKYAGEDKGSALALLEPMILFDKTIMQFPSIKRSPGGASTDLVPVDYFVNQLVGYRSCKVVLTIRFEEPGRSDR